MLSVIGWAVRWVFYLDEWRSEFGFLERERIHVDLAY